jgi:galactose mutarotase-like enzyme
VTATAAPEYGTAELRAGDARVVIAPGLGGKIVSMWIGGREWLWSDPKLPHRAGQNADSGGLDECFPTAAACNLPAITGRYTALHLPNAYSGLALPDRGELWSQPATFSLETKDEGVYATCGWGSERMPYSFVRSLHVSNDGRVLMRYGVRNDGLDRLPYVWSAQAVLPLTKRTHIELPDGARLRVWRQHGVELGGVGAENRWPRVAAAGKLLDLSHPDSVARRYACKLFVDAPSGRVAIEEEGARLEVNFDPARCPAVALWINRKGWSGHPKQKPPVHLAIGPASGAPDSLAEALGPWKAAQWLEPGETKEWSVTWRAMAGA